MNETKIEVSFNNDVKGEKKLEQYEERLKNIYAMLQSFNSGTSNKIATIDIQTRKIKTSVDKLSTSATSLGKSFTTAFGVAKAAAFIKSLEMMSKKLTDLVGLSAAYVENINLLEVAYSNADESIEKSSARIESYIDKMSAAYGLDESRLTRQFGIFKQLANAMELPTETAENLSEIMVKMTNDVASLYNLDFNRASNALQSALVGQVRPIRGATGADITEKTLQKTIDNLGLDRSISDLSFVEKRLVMVISLTEQLKNSQGDYARTIESTTNQMKVMHEQWDRLSRAVGNVFYPILSKVLPYLNAILMVLTEIFSMIAKLVGFKMPEFDYSSLSGVSDAAMDLEDELNGAGTAVDKLGSKLKGLRGFDKLNVINTPSASGASAGGGVGGGAIDPTILNAFDAAFSKYNDLMDSVKMKATKIKEDIMKWLGFKKGINEETGEIEWQYQGIGKTIDNMIKSFKKLNPLVKTLVELLALVTAVKIYTGIKNLVALISGTTLIKSLKNIVQYTQLYATLSGSKTQGILAGVDAWKKNATSAEKFSTSMGGATGVIVGLNATADGMKKINEEGINLGNTLEVVGGGLSTIAGGAMIGASIGGGWGALIGAAGGAILAITDAILHYEDAGDRMVRKSKEYLAEIQATGDGIKESLAETEMEITSAMSMTNYHEKLLDELNSIVDENGKIQSGYEDRAEFILNELSSAYGVEYKLVDGVVQNQEEFNKKIQEAIRLKEAEILLEAYKDDYIEALKQQKSLYADLQDAERTRNGYLAATKEIMLDNNLSLGDWLELDSKVRQGIKLTAQEQKIYNDNMGMAKLVANDTIKAYRNYDTAVAEAAENYATNAGIITRYSDFQAAVETGNLEKIDEARDQYTRTYIKDGKTITQSEKDEAEQREYDRVLELQNWKKNNDERYNTYKQMLTNMDNYTKGVTPQMAQAWANLGHTSMEDFLTEFSKLDEGMQKDIIDAMYENGVQIDEELQRGLNSKEISKSVKIAVDDYAAKQRLQNIHSSITNAFGILGISVPPLQFAGGGLPKVGQIFIANERGPELVDQIGGQSFVANQKQIGEFMDERYGKYNQPVNVTIPVSVGGEQLGTIVLNNLQELAKTNGTAITIG